MPDIDFSPGKVLAGRNIFFVGGTGFLGKVTLSMLLDRFPQVGKIYLMVRAGSSGDSDERFWNNVFTSPAFDPLRQRYGSRVKDYLSEKLVILGGDITNENLGYSDEAAQKIADDIDIVLNSSGNVSFNPPLETALKTNVTGTKNLLAFVKRMKRPALIHTSTCFVAGNRSGQVWEDEPVLGYFPRREELDDVQFSVEQELKDCERMIRNVVEEATDATLNAEFRTIARKRLIEEGRDPDDHQTLNLAAARERKDWIRNKMSKLGLDRAKWWGWPNIYTYTKSMGEQLIAAETGIVRAIVRPAIVESSMAYPFTGWNEGFNTTAPLILFALNGQNEFPVNEKLVLDIIPVDFVASALLAVTAQACVEEPKQVFQLCSGDVNPNRLRRIVGLLGLYKRKHFRDKESGNRFVNAIAARMEAHPVSDDYFRRLVPFVKRKSSELAEYLEKRKPYGIFSGILDQLKKGAQRLEAFTTEGLEAYEQFRPFMIKNEYRFRADNVRALFARLPEEERESITWAPEKIDWYTYWLKIHFPGLQKWVFPKMEEIGRPKPKRIYTYRNLMEMFDAVTKIHAKNLAMRMERNGELEEYTYADVRELVLRVAAFLTAQGIIPDDKVGLLAENSPEWGISYFGTLKAGATCIPLDKDLTDAEVVNLLLAGNAKGLIISDKMLRKKPRLKNALKEEGLNVAIWKTSYVFELTDESQEQELISKLPAKSKPTAIASLIFTSGTTGNPKGVMLTQKNLTSMMSQLLKVYDVGPEDGFLSILPMHHTFEFSTGFLLPFSRGAVITYLEDLTGDSISDALKSSRVTIIVGVPALWDLLRRRILNKFRDKSHKLEEFIKMMVSVNKWVRKKSPLNFGPFLFLPVHFGLGGKIRYLISGGSALSEKTFDTFYGLGFQLNEGYGLTESSPVLTVTRPGSKPKPGSVGQPLPGVEIRIINQNEQGIGEVIARGPNIMAGYFQNKEATDAAMKDDWLYTGDLGYIDESGNLFLVGRSKDIIVGSSGKNVYPDEIEELYRHHSLIKELSIVGLPEEGEERIACVVVPDYEADVALSREEVREQLEEHFRTISGTLPIYKRVKVLEFWDEELPRTGTRKVKRREVIARLQKELSHRVAAPLELPDSGEYYWLREIIASVCGKDVSEIHRNSSFDELGFDSLMYTELGAAIEASGRTLPSFNGLSAISNVSELADFLHLQRLPAKVAHSKAEEKDDEAIHVPDAVAALGRIGLGIAHRILYQQIMESEVSGKTNIPPHTNFIVAPNHSSHLDTGLVRHAFGDAAKNMVAVAAADYFFDNKYKRAFFESFTNLIPMERSGSMHESFKLAEHYLKHGHNLLLFAEGTRSATGRMTDFKFSLGYLALRAKKGIVPVYLSGTHDAMPKGKTIPKRGKLSAQIGPFLSYELLQELTQGMPKNEAYRLVTMVTQKVVEDLRDGRKPTIDVQAIRREWLRQTPHQIEKAASVTAD